jgi:GNAT superfamily N-acetyltransferase
LISRIRDPLPADEPAWRKLWAGYNLFYDAKVADKVTAATWHRILDPASPVFARLAEQNGIVVGFAICVLHEGTWNIEPVCYLEDLFVGEDHRGANIGRALITDLIELGRQRGWARLYWHTRADNVIARRLYDGFIEADDFVRYRLPLR